MHPKFVCGVIIIQADIEEEDDEDDAPLISVCRVADLVLYFLTSLSLLPRADPLTSILL